MVDEGLGTDGITLLFFEPSNYARKNLDGLAHGLQAAVLVFRVVCGLEKKKREK